MTARNGGSSNEWTRARKLTRAVALVLLACAVVLPLPAQGENGQEPGDLAQQIALLRDQLEQPGADGAATRSRAVERLMAIGHADAHRALSRVLARSEDPDGVRLLILRSLARQLVLVKATQFGAADDVTRQQIVLRYLSVLSRWWLPAEPVPEGLQAAAVRALQLVPARELEQSARVLLKDSDVESKVAVFRCFADLQSLYLGQLIADHLEVEQGEVRDAARRSLRLLTFDDQEFDTLAQFTNWSEQNAGLRYVDLAQRAARAAAQRRDEVLDQVESERLRRARDVVNALATPSPQVRWTEIQKETLVADVGRMQACLEVLQRVLAARLPEGDARARQAFCTALLDRWQKTDVERVGLRAQMLEVAAYTVRPGEAELATRIQGLLIAGLQSADVAAQAAALHGLRRFPSPAARSTVVDYASAAARDATAVGRVRSALATLSSLREPRWSAPSPDAEDKQRWLQLIRSVFSRPELSELRDAALELALLDDSKGQPLPEVFDLLLGLAQDAGQDAQLRQKSIIQLQSWRAAREKDRVWVAALHRLIADKDDSVRKQAAEALGKLVQNGDAARKGEWLPQTITELQRRLSVEQKGLVLERLAESMTLCGKEPEMSGLAIAAVNSVLTAMGTGGAVEAADRQKQQRLVDALFRIASHANARGNDVWLDACEPLLALGAGNHKELRQLFREHSVMDSLRGKVGAADAVVATRARRAMQIVIRTALLSPAEESWRSPSRRDEVQDVLAAFRTLDAVPDAVLDGPRHRLLRLEVEVAAGNAKAAVERGGAWLADAAEAAPWSPEQRGRALLLVAEAHLAQSQPELAAERALQRDANRALSDAEATLLADIAKAQPPAQAGLAVTLLDRVRTVTTPEHELFRARLVAWATAAVALDPKQRGSVWDVVQEHADRFADANCSKELRQAFEGLRVQQ